MKKPMTVTCIIMEKKGLDFSIQPDLNNPGSLTYVPHGPGYVAKVLGGPIDGQEIFIRREDKSSESIRLEVNQKVTILREPYYWFFYSDYLKQQNGEPRGVNINW